MYATNIDLCQNKLKNFMSLKNISNAAEKKKIKEDYV